VRRAVLEELRLQGYAPRTLLDVGSNVGAFAQKFLRVFPDCVPTLVEPNPHCQDELARLPFERHAFAASAEAGRAELFLSSEWLASTGASLYRENTAYFRDELLLRQEVDKARLDDVFAGRRFDFVKIDTQGSELEALQGGQELLRQADYILVEVSLVQFNLGAPSAEGVFEQLAAMGFRCAEVTDFHRMEDLKNDDLLQMDFLFQREVQRPCQTWRYGPLNQPGPLLEFIAARRGRCRDFSVIDVGGAPWMAGAASASFGPGAAAPAALHFAGELDDPVSWEPLLRHVSRHGRFSYAVCAHAIQTLARPSVVLEMLPRIADAGCVSVPSRYLESVRPEGPYRGFLHHRWVVDVLDGELTLAPKIPLVEHMLLSGEPGWAAERDRFELQLYWRGAIGFSELAAADRNALISLYGRFFDRP
jgi:FkbM family methyltransferase